MSLLTFCHLRHVQHRDGASCLAQCTRAATWPLTWYSVCCSPLRLLCLFWGRFLHPPISVFFIVAYQKGVNFWFKKNKNTLRKFGESLMLFNHHCNSASKTEDCFLGFMISNSFDHVAFPNENLKRSSLDEWKKIFTSIGYLRIKFLESNAQFLCC